MATNPLKTPEGDFRIWTVVAVVVITIIIILNSTSPRTAIYVLALFFLVVGGLVALVSRFSADTD